MAASVVYSLHPIRFARFDPNLANRSKQPFRSAKPNFRRQPYPTAASPGSFSGLRYASSGAGLPLRNLTSMAASLYLQNPLLNDITVAGLTGAVALSLLRLWGEIAKRGIFDRAMNRKLVHISVGLVFILFWPFFSDQPQAALLAALVPGVNIIKMLLLGLGIWKDEGTVKSMSRHGDYRELLKGPLYYACTITLACAIYWRTSPISIAAICNLCAGDGMADIVGRRCGKQKLPYNSNKSYIGSFTMAMAGFISSIGYMHYFSLFGLVQESWQMAVGFFIVSLASALVESHPISSDLDDNLTVPLTSVLVGSLVF